MIVQSVRNTMYICTHAKQRMTQSRPIPIGVFGCKVSHFDSGLPQFANTHQLTCYKVSFMLSVSLSLTQEMNREWGVLATREETVCLL